MQYLFLPKVLLPKTTLQAWLVEIESADENKFLRTQITGTHPQGMITVRSD